MSIRCHSCNVLLKISDPARLPANAKCPKCGATVAVDQLPPQRPVARRVDESNEVFVAQEVKPDQTKIPERQTPGIRNRLVLVAVAVALVATVSVVAGIGWRVAAQHDNGDELSQVVRPVEIFAEGDEETGDETPAETSPEASDSVRTEKKSSVDSEAVTPKSVKPKKRAAPRRRLDPDVHFLARCLTEAYAIDGKLKSTISQEAMDAGVVRIVGEGDPVKSQLAYTAYAFHHGWVATKQRWDKAAAYEKIIFAEWLKEPEKSTKKEAQRKARIRAGVLAMLKGRRQVHRDLPMLQELTRQAWFTLLPLVKPGTSQKLNGSGVELINHYRKFSRASYNVSLYATNRSRGTFTNATLVVTLKHAWGASVRNHYFIPEWKPDSKLSLQIPIGWGMPALARTIAADYQLICDSGSLNGQSEFPDRRKMAIEERFEKIEAADLQNSFTSVERYAKDIAAIAVPGSHEAKRAQEYMDLSLKARRDVLRLQAILRPGAEWDLTTRVEEILNFGPVRTVKFGIVSIKNGGTASRSVTAMLIHPKAPDRIRKRMVGRIQFMKDSGIPRLELTSVKGSGLKGNNGYFSQGDERAFNFRLIGNELVGTLGRATMRMPLSAEEMAAAQKAVVTGVAPGNLASRLDPATPEWKDYVTTPAQNVSKVPAASLRQGPKAEIVFQNRTGQVVAVFWRDTKGKLQSYGHVQPNTSRQYSTFGGHVWEVQASGGKKLMAFVAKDVNSLAVVDRESVRKASGN